MAAPEIIGYSSAGPTYGTSINITAPSGYQAGDLLLAVGSKAYNATSITLSWTDSFTNLQTEGNTTSNQHITLDYKIATGSEGTITLSHTAGSGYMACRIYLIR